MISYVHALEDHVALLESRLRRSHPSIAVDHLSPVLQQTSGILRLLAPSQQCLAKTHLVNWQDLNEAILNWHWAPAGRAGIFLVSFTYLLTVFGMNIGANSIPFGADMNGLLPKLLTIRRGQVLCAVLSVCFVPWELIAAAQTFITFLGS
jgi:cytosine/uracil/thiamine/allantoin permease